MYMLFSGLNIDPLMQYQQYKYMGIQLDQSWRAHEPVSVLKPLNAIYHSALLMVTCISLLDGLLWISEGSNVVLIFKLPPYLTCLLSIDSLNMKTRSQDWVPLKTTKYRTEWKETTQQWVLPAKKDKSYKWMKSCSCFMPQQQQCIYEDFPEMYWINKLTIWNVSGSRNIKHFITLMQQRGRFK